MSEETVKARVVGVVERVKMPTVWAFAYTTLVGEIVVYHISSGFKSREAAESVARIVASDSISTIRIIEIPGEE